MNQQQQQQSQQQQFYQSQNPNASISGPPTTGLFDYLKNDKSFQTPTKNFLSHQQSQSFTNQQSFQDASLMNQSGFNQSRIMSPISNVNNNTNAEYNNSYHQNSTYQTTMPAVPLNGFSNNNNNFWITIFGFPQNAITAILSHFSQCGSILEKVCSSGNWIHLRFSSRMECDKALLYNGKIICNNLMIGVTRCTDSNLIEKENDGGLQSQRDVNVSKIRSLTHSAYKSAQEPTEVVLSPNAPKRTTGIINKTLDLFFGW
jgi:nuclear pore complex protein Nup53